MIKIYPGLSVTTTEDAVSSSAIDNLNLYLKSWIGTKVTPPAPPPWEGGWLPVTPEGRISKRISKWARAEMGVKLDKYQLNVIGNNAANLIIPKGTTITITDKFDWDPGDYGDEDSCFFGSKRQTWPMLSRIGGMAALITNTGERAYRCLILHWQDKPYFFNFYGIAPYDGKALMAAAFDWPMRDVVFSFLGDAKDPLYVNSSMAFTFDDGKLGGYADDYVDMRSNELYEKVDRYGLYCEHCLRKLVDAPRYSDPRGEDDDKSIAYVCQECYPQLEKSERVKWTDAYLIPVPLWVEGTTTAPAKKMGQRYDGTATQRYQWQGQYQWQDNPAWMPDFTGNAEVTIVGDDNDIQWEDVRPPLVHQPSYARFIEEAERQWVNQLGAYQCDCGYCVLLRQRFMQSLCDYLPSISVEELLRGLAIVYGDPGMDMEDVESVAILMMSEEMLPV